MAQSFSDNPSDPDRKAVKKSKLPLIFLVAVVFGLGIGFGLMMNRFDQQRQEAKQAWDASKGHPEAAYVVRDYEDVTTYVPKTLNAIDDGWDTCSDKSCARQDIGHYPLVFKLGFLDFDNGCFVIYPKVSVGNLRAASSKDGGQYKLTYNPDGTKITLCVIASPQKDDEMVLWSEDIAATR